MPSEPPLLSLKNVVVYRGPNRALDSLTLEIPQRQHVAVIGPNGCGKSTLVKTIAREVHPLWSADSSVEILGRRNYNIFELRPLLGIVSDDLVRRSRRRVSGRDAVLSGFFSTLELWPHTPVTTEMTRKADAILKLLEIPHLAERPVAEMSSGESRRVLIGRALAHDPRTLILDEPTNSLDMHAVHELRGVLSKLAASGVGIVLVTHNLPDVIPEIERVILMREGSVFADGPKREILTAERLSELFRMKVELVERDGLYQIW